MPGKLLIYCRNRKEEDKLLYEQLKAALQTKYNEIDIVYHDAATPESSPEKYDAFLFADIGREGCEALKARYEIDHPWVVIDVERQVNLKTKNNFSDSLDEDEDEEKEEIYFNAVVINTLDNLEFDASKLDEIIDIIDTTPDYKKETARFAENCAIDISETLNSLERSDDFNEKLIQETTLSTLNLICLEYAKNEIIKTKFDTVIANCKQKFTDFVAKREQSRRDIPIDGRHKTTISVCSGISLFSTFGIVTIYNSQRIEKSITSGWLQRFDKTKLLKLFERINKLDSKKELYFPFIMISLTFAMASCKMYKTCNSMKSHISVQIDVDTQDIKEQIHALYMQARVLTKQEKLGKEAI